MVYNIYRHKYLGGEDRKVTLQQVRGIKEKDS